VLFPLVLHSISFFVLSLLFASLLSFVLVVAFCASAFHAGFAPVLKACAASRSWGLFSKGFCVVLRGMIAVVLAVLFHAGHWPAANFCAAATFCSCFDFSSCSCLFVFWSQFFLILNGIRITSSTVLWGPGLIFHFVRSSNAVLIFPLICSRSVPLCFAALRSCHMLLRPSVMRPLIWSAGQLPVLC